MNKKRSLINEWRCAKSAEERTEIDKEIGEEMVEITRMLDASVHPDDIPIVLAAVEQYSVIKRAQMEWKDKLMVKLLKTKHVIQVITVKIPWISREEE